MKIKEINGVCEEGRNLIMGMELKDYLQTIIENEGFKRIERLYTHLGLVLPQVEERRKREREEERERERDQPKRFDIDEVVSLSNRLVIIGEPGAGKTTSLKYLTLKYARQALEGKDDLIPIYLDLAWFDKERAENFLSSNLKANRFPTPIEEWLKRGRFLVLIDGLDIPTEDPTGLIRDLIINEFPDNRYILASRRSPRYEALPEEYKQVEILGLDKEKIKEYIAKYIEDPSQRQALERRVFEEPTLLQIASNPMMLAMMIAIFKELGELPQNRSCLYGEFIDLLYKHLGKRRVSLKTNLTKINRFLNEKAFELLCENKLGTVEKMEELDTDEDLRTDLKQWGLIEGERIEQGEARYRFSPHQTFQEYFAARKLKELYENNVDISVVFEHPRWREVLLFLSGLLPDSTQLIEDIRRTDIFLAAQCLAQAAGVDGAIKDGMIKELYRLAEDRYRYNRERAVECIGLIGDEKSIRVLLLRLKYDSWSVQNRAAEVLARIGKEAVLPLIERLKDRDSDVRYWAAEALGRIGAKEAVLPLIERLEDEDRRVQNRAAKALGRIGAEEAVLLLIERLEDESADVRYYAAEVLGEIGAKEAVLPLIERLEDGGFDMHMRWMAAIALGKIGAEEAVLLLIERLKDKDYFVRYWAAIALGEIGAKEAVLPLIERLEDENSSVQKKAAEALGEIGAKEAVLPLIERLEDENSDVRKSAAEALGRIGAEEAVSPLIEMLKDRYSSVRYRAAEALGRIGAKEAVLPLIERLEDEDSDVRKSAAIALGKIGAEEAVLPLIERLEDKDSDVRASAAEALGEIGAEEAVLPLIERLEDKDSDVRKSAAEALGKIGAKEAVLPLIERLKGIYSGVQGSAAEALGKIGAKEAVLPLIERLKDRDSYVRWRAEKALAKIGDEAIIPQLEGSDTDEAYSVIWAIRERENGKPRIRRVRQSLQKIEPVERILWATKLIEPERFKEFTDISLDDVSVKGEDFYDGLKISYQYMNPIYPCIFQYFNDKGYPGIVISLSYIDESGTPAGNPDGVLNLLRGNITAAYKIEGIMDDFRQMVMKDGRAEFGLTIDPARLFKYEGREIDLTLKVEFNKGESWITPKPIKIASKNSILWSIKEKDMFELIAAFVTPNDPEIDAFISRVKQRFSHLNFGYYTTEEEMLGQIKAFYQILTEDNFGYVTTTLDFTGDQSVQLPSETLKEKRGNCIELSLLFASLCELLEIHPIIVFIPGHAFFGFESYSGSGEFYFLETTDLSIKSFEDAIRDGFREYRENPQKSVIIDIKKARDLGIKPISL
jgi:HEAT repeat protein